MYDRTSLLPTLLTLYALTAFAPAAAAAQVDAGALPALDAPDSHEALYAYTKTAHTQLTGMMVGAYDAWLAQRPTDVSAAIERCKFLRLSESAQEDQALDDEASDVPARGSSEGCAEALFTRFPITPSVLQFRLERLWGPAAQAFGASTLARTDIAWSNRDRALFTKHLAYQLFWQGKNDEAARYAREARLFEKSVDVGLILASDYQARGLRERAIAELAAGSDTTYAQRKITLLVELEAFREAQTLIDSDPKVSAFVPALVHARVLEALGKSAAARAKYDELSAQQWNRQAGMRRLFYLDLASDDRDRAVKAYAALRDQGYNADPVLRHRLALARAFPSAPWSLRDLFGLLGLVALALFTVALPAAIILPVHYVGLLRGERATPTTPAGERWSLKQLWLIAASILLSDIMTTYLFAPDELHAWLLDEPAATSTRLEVARNGVARILVGACAVLAWLRADDIARWIRGRWTFRRTFSIAMLCVLAFYFVAAFSVGVARGLKTADGADASVAGVGLTTLEVMQVVRDLYGGVTLFPLVALIVPVYEEIAFRGVFLGSIARHLPFAWANVVQAAAFALAHDQVEHYPPLFALAIMAGIAFKRSGGLAAPILMHVAINTVAVLAICAQPSLASPRREGRKDPPLVQLNGDALRAHCDRDEGASCYRLGIQYYFGTGVTQDYAMAAPLLAKACDGGVAAACGTLGLQYGLAYGFEKNVVRASQLFALGCDGADANACRNLGVAFEQGLGVTSDQSAAVRFLEKACALGEPEGCNDFGRHYHGGWGVPRDLERAAKFYEKACNGGSAAGCANFGRAHRQGGGVRKDPKRATELFTRACDTGELSACADLGAMLMDGEGQSKDSARAEELLRRACEGGQRDACTGLGTLYHSGPDALKDAALAARWFGKGCDQGDASSCFQLAGLHERGEGVTRDVDLAEQLMRKACAGGLEGPACEGKEPPNRRAHRPLP